MKIHNLFPTPVYEHEGTIEETFLVQDEIRKKLDSIREADSFENPIGWGDGVQTNIKKRINTIHDFELVHLKKYINKHVVKYVEMIGAFMPVPIMMAHSWVNITEKGQYQNWHQHRDSTISGCYYYQTSGEDGDITFETPVPYVNLEIFPAGGHCVRHEAFKPKVGKLFLFPGWLNHRVGVNNTDTPRISFAFNFLRDHFYNKPRD